MVGTAASGVAVSAGVVTAVKLSVAARACPCRDDAITTEINAVIAICRVDCLQNLGKGWSCKAISSVLVKLGQAAHRRVQA